MKPHSVDSFVRRRGGVVTVREARTECSRDALATALRECVLVRLNRTTLSLPGISRARQEALRHRGLVSHLDAAMGHGWKVKRPPDRPSITVPRGRKIRQPARAKVHYADIEVPLPGALTSPVDTVIACARDLPFDEALSVADQALRSGKVTRSELSEAASRSPRTGRRRAERVVAVADPRADNPFESVLRAIALEVPGFTASAQCPVRGVGHCDVGDAGLLLALEAESFEFHAEKEAFNYDVRRYTAMVCLGWLVARFTWDDVMHRPDYVAATIARLVQLRTKDGRSSRTRRSRAHPA